CEVQPTARVQPTCAKRASETSEPSPRRARAGVRLANRRYGISRRGRMTLASTGEFELVERVTARLATAPTTLVGPGGEAALGAPPDGRVVASTDVLVEGRHFRCDWASAVDIGHRAAAASLADVAAMGAVANALLVALCVPPELDPRWVEQMTDGLVAEAG